MILHETKNSMYEEVGVHARLCETLVSYPTEATPRHAANAAQHNVSNRRVDIILAHNIENT